MYPPIEPYVSGMLEVSAPPDIAWQLARSWPAARLLLVDEGHGASHASTAQTLVEAPDGFAARSSV